MSPLAPVNDMTPNRGARAAKPAPAADEAERRELRKACAEFESLFMNYLLKEMRSTVPESGLVSGGTAESIYTSMMDAQMAREIAFSRGIGMADLFERQMQASLKKEE
jgi:flagellar protein FlgJ